MNTINICTHIQIIYISIYLYIWAGGFGCEIGCQDARVHLPEAFAGAQLSAPLVEGSEIGRGQFSSLSKVNLVNFQDEPACDACATHLIGKCKLSISWLFFELQVTKCIGSPKHMHLQHI